MDIMIAMTLVAIGIISYCVRKIKEGSNLKQSDKL